MAENIVEAVRQFLGEGPVQKVDPNHQDVKDAHALSALEKLSQASIPAVLTAYAMFAKAENGADRILNGRHLSLQELFLGKQQQVADSIAEYASVPAAEVKQTMEKITHAAIEITLQAVGENPTPDKIRNYLAGQRHNILGRLPASLQLGKLLGNNSLDDRTNKMEGPMSNIAHAIEQALSGSEMSK